MTEAMEELGGEFVAGELRIKAFEGRKDGFTDLFASILGQRFAPGFAAPAVFEGAVFQVVDLVFSDREEAAFERGEPVIVLPVAGDGAEGVAGEFGERVMCDVFAAVEKERDAVTPAGAGERLVMGLEIAHEDGAVAETVFTIADEF